MTRAAPLALALATAALAAPPAAAQSDDALVGFNVLAPATALKAAQAALDHCAGLGYQVGVHVTDRFGTPQVFLRDRFAGAHVYETSFRKAWTAASFGDPTSDLATATGPDSAASGIRGGRPWPRRPGPKDEGDGVSRALERGSRGRWGSRRASMRSSTT